MASPPQMAPPPYAPGAYVHAFAITPGVAFSPSVATRAIYVATTGNMTMTFAGDTAQVTLTGLLAGWVYEFSISACSASTCTGLVGLY